MGEALPALLWAPAQARVLVRAQARPRPASARRWSMAEAVKAAPEQVQALAGRVPVPLQAWPWHPA